MIYAVGLHTDRTMRHFLTEARGSGTDVALIDLRAVGEGDWKLSLPGGAPPWVVAGGTRVDLDPEAPYFCRLIDLSPVIEEKARAAAFRGWIAGLVAWLELIPGCVINRPGHYADNSAKPLHEATLRAAGFAVPPSLTSSNGDRLAAFAAEGPTVVKAISGVRADCRSVAPEEFVNFASERGPVHLQRRIEGFDVRAHVVGGVVHAESITSGAIDYRAAEEDCVYCEFALPVELEAKIIAATTEFGLTFAGWDFKVTAAGEVWCLEVNPMPGYNGYDVRAGGCITRSIVLALERHSPGLQRTT